MTDVAGEVDVAAALAGVVVVADAVFLRAAAVVDIVEQVGIAEYCQRAKERRLVDGRHSLLEVAEAEDAVGRVAHLPPYHEADGGHSDSSIFECFFVSHGVGVGV